MTAQTITVAENVELNNLLADENYLELTDEDYEIIEELQDFFGISKEEALTRHLTENYDGLIYDEYLEDAYQVKHLPAALWII